MVMAQATPSEATAVRTGMTRKAVFKIRPLFKTFADMADVLVGPNEVRFVIHKQLLVNRSPFFSAALDGRFSEGDSQCVRLPEEIVEAFEHVVYWMYAGRLDDGFVLDGRPSFFLLLHLYGLADRLCMERLRNATVDELARLAEKTNSVLTPSDTHILFEDIRDNAPVRRLVLDLFVFKKTENLLETHPDDWHPRFLRELAVRLKRPGRVSYDRHRFERWQPQSWSRTRACDFCRMVLSPSAEAHACQDCSKALCHGCVRKAECKPLQQWPIDNTCKPWNRDMCFYHEHFDTEGCHAVEEDAKDGAVILREKVT